MPFIDLNTTGSTTTTNSGVVPPIPATTPLPVAATPAPAPTTTPLLSTVPQPEIREVKGPAFASPPVTPAPLSVLAESLPNSTQQITAAPVAPAVPAAPISPEPAPVVDTPAVELPATLPVAQDFSLQPEAPAAQTAEADVPQTAITEPTTPQYAVPGLPTLPSLAAAPVATPEPGPLPVSEPTPAVAEAVPVVEAQAQPPELPSLPPLIAPNDGGQARLKVKATSAGGNLKTKSYTLPDLLSQAVGMGASDIHLTDGYRAMARVDGKLTEIQSQVLKDAEIKAMLQEVVKNNPRADLEKHRDLDLSYEIIKPAVRFRVNIFKQKGTFSAVFRVIPNEIRTPDELKLPQIVKEFITLPQGLVLVTGPTGSGKTTSLASLINMINQRRPAHIVTIEDPIEYVYPKGLGLVDQRAVYIDTKDWTAALRAVLRQDPDVVLIGEMRDVETMEAALQIAETGHLVFSTLHTNSAAQTIDRIIDAFPDSKQSQVRTQLANSLMAVISQRLVPVNGGGRRVAAELLVVTAAVRNAIREAKVYQIDNMIQTGGELGMVTMEKSLVGLIREGVISTEMAQSFALRPDELLTLLGQNRK